MSSLTYSPLITRKQLSALSGGMVDKVRYRNPLCLGTPFNSYGSRAIATKDGRIHHICLIEGNNEPLPESTDQVFVTNRYAVNAKASRGTDEKQDDKPQLQRDVHLLLKWLEGDSTHPPIPLFWEPSNQSTKLPEGGKGVAYVGHWSVTGVEAKKFNFKGKERCARIFFRFDRYDKEFDSIITMAHDKSCDKIYQMFRREKEANDSSNGEIEKVVRSENIDTEGKGRILRSRNRNSGASSANNNQFASDDEDDEAGEEEEEEEEEDLYDDTNYEEEDDAMTFEAGDPESYESNRRGQGHRSIDNSREAVEQEDSNSVPSVAVAPVNRNSSRAAIPHRPESSRARTNPKPYENNMRLGQGHRSDDHSCEVAQQDETSNFVARNGAPSVAVAPANHNPSRASIPQRPEASGANRGVSRRAGITQAPIRRARRDRKRAAVPREDQEVIELLDDSSDEEDSSAKKPRREPVYFTICLEGRDEDPAFFVELSTSTATFQDLRNAIAEQVQEIDYAFIFILNPLGRVSQNQERLQMIERFHKVINGNGQVDNPYCIVIKEMQK